jgi:hypothetical protein
LNEFLGKAEEVDKDKVEKGSSFNKGEIEGAIRKLKDIQVNL